MAYSYEGFEPIFYCVITGRVDWNNLAPLDTTAEIWEKKFIKKKLTAQDQAYTEVYKDAVNEYSDLVIWYSNLSELEKNEIYQEWSKKNLLANIKYSHEH
jgi:hypothetical protein